MLLEWVLLLRIVDYMFSCTIVSLSRILWWQYGSQDVGAPLVKLIATKSVSGYETYQEEYLDLKK